MKRNFIRNGIIFALVMGNLFMADLILKHYFFDFKGIIDYPGEVQHDWAVIGIRSYAHSSSTFLTFLNIDMVWSTKVAINSSIAGVLIIFGLISKSKFKVAAIAVMVAGVLGNNYDVIMFDYVRDILYTPWLDRGTFNLADILIIAGAVLLITSIFVENKKKRA